MFNCCDDTFFSFLDNFFCSFCKVSVVAADCLVRKNFYFCFIFLNNFRFWFRWFYWCSWYFCSYFNDLINRINFVCRNDFTFFFNSVNSHDFYDCCDASSFSFLDNFFCSFFKVCIVTTDCLIRNNFYFCFFFFDNLRFWFRWFYWCSWYFCSNFNDLINRINFVCRNNFTFFFNSINNHDFYDCCDATSFSFLNNFFFTFFKLSVVTTDCLIRNNFYFCFFFFDNLRFWFRWFYWCSRFFRSYFNDFINCINLVC